MAIASDILAIVGENISVGGKLFGTYSAAKKIVNWCYGQKAVISCV